MSRRGVLGGGSGTGVATRRCAVTAKVGYARQDAERLARRARQRFEDPVQAYRCRRCHDWHIGHTDGQELHARRPPPARQAWA